MTAEPARSTPGKQSPRAWLAPAGACAALLLLFAILGYTAIRTKTATYDEPLHVVGGFMHRYFGDFRINPEDPALFGYWASIPHKAASLIVDTQSPEYRLIPIDIRRQWNFVINTLYRTKENDADDILNESRFMLMML